MEESGEAVGDLDGEKEERPKGGDGVFWESQQVT